MQDVFDAEFSSLHVRITNKAAIHLYTETLGYESHISKELIKRASRIHDIEKKYYADGENAYDMRRDFKKKPAT